MMEKTGYQENYEFWTSNRKPVIGDVARYASIKLLDPKPGEYILDAGCGAGFISRLLAKVGAEVCGCDRDEKMLAAAREQEKIDHLDIDYRLHNITNLYSFSPSCFDAIACIAVLIHNSYSECKNFFKEAHRLLKKSGRIIVSVTHETVYESIQYGRNWLKHEPIEPWYDTVSPKVKHFCLANDIRPMEPLCKKFKETYCNSEGQVFSSVVFRHPHHVIIELMERSGFEVVHTQTQWITSKILKQYNAKDATGYPAFWQVLAIKP